MNTLIPPRRAENQRHYGSRIMGFALAAVAMLASMNAFSQATVTTLGGDPAGSANPATAAGYQDGYTYLEAQFNFPAGVALDSSDSTLFLADYNNNAVRMVTQLGDDANSYTYSPFKSAQGISHPIAVAVDGQTNVYVLNYGSGKNGTLLKFNGSDYMNYLYLNPSWTTNATQLTNATALALDNLTNAYVTVQSNTVIRITPGGVSSVVGTITNAGTYLRGIVVMDNGQLALSDAGNNGIWMMNPGNTNLTGNAVQFTGFHGAGDQIGAASFASFNGPANIAKAGNGVLVVADYNNAKVKVISTNGTVTRLFGINPTYWYGSYPGWTDGTVSPNEQQDLVQARQPYGLAIAHDGTVYDTEDYYCLVRGATGTGLPQLPPPPPAAPTILGVTTNYGTVTLHWTTVPGASSYNVKRSPSSGGPYDTLTSVSTNGYTDASVINGTTYYYVVSAVNSGGIESADSIEASATVPIPPPPAPIIGWYDYEGTSLPFTTVMHPVSGAPYTSFNDLTLAVNPAVNGVSTLYTADGTTPSVTTTNGSTPPYYADHLVSVQPLPVNTSPDLVIKAVSFGPGGSSAVSTAEFLFQVGAPIINGNNAAQFKVNDITSGAQMYYTTDGSDPSSTNITAVGPIYDGTTLSLAVPPGTNLTFKIRGYKANYQPSAVATTTFSSSNVVANTISFGFVSGEASSDFTASPGQKFYAPVTLTTLPGTKIYSLQFYMVVTNGGMATNAGPPVASGAFSFKSMLLKPSSDQSGYFESIPPAMFVSYITNQVVVTNNSVVQTNNIISQTFTNLEFINSASGLLGVGWLERASETNLYNTKAQTLTTYSQAHDDLFPNVLQPNGAIVGGYVFQVPITATNGQQYQIQIARPSATDDGVGSPGSDVYIAAPTNGSTAGGYPINALKLVTVGQRKYIAGSVYPFRWLNAGDFGSSNIVNADVEQVFQSAIYSLNYPAIGSDFFDAMDSCGYTYINNGNGYLEKNTQANTSVLFNGNDISIDQIAFGDGVLDVCDVYVTYRRSLDPSLTWFQRYWNNGELVAQTVPNVSAHVLSKQTSSDSPTVQPKVQPSSVLPQVNFTAGDIQGAAGQVIQIPITAKIFGSYPLRVLMLNLTVEPLDGSPALTTPVQFNQSAPLGSPYTTDSKGNGNYSAVWLNSTVAGLTGTVTIGTLSVTIPATASASAAYAVHFDHASASPNGLASFPKQTLTGLITLSSRTNSSFGDGIPDSWRLRWFGTVNNYLSLSNACPSGDGVDNYKKYVAGVDPNMPDNFPSVNAKTPVPSGSTSAIHWPTVSGKQYVIERSTSLFPGAWTAISTNTGTGTDMEFDDNSGNAVKFYRVRILP